MKTSPRSLSASLFLFLLLFTFTITSRSFAQADSSNFQLLNKLHYKNTWAIFTNVSRYNNFTNTTDFSVGVKRIIGNSTYLTGQVTFIGLLDKFSNYSLHSNNGQIPAYFYYGGNTITGTKLSIQLVYYLINKKVVNLFITGGPVFLTYTKNENQTNYNIKDQSQVNRSYTKVNDNVLGEGLSADIGVEWNITKPFSIFAEYGMLGVNSHHSVKIIEGNYTGPHTTQSSYKRNLFEAHLSNLKLGVMFYL